MILVKLQRFMNEISSNESFPVLQPGPPNAFLSSSSNSSASSNSCGPPWGTNISSWAVGRWLSFPIFMGHFLGFLSWEPTFFSEKKRSRSSFPRTFWSSFHSFSFLNKTQVGMHFEEQTNENHQGILPRFTQRGSLIEGCDMIGYMTLLPQDPGPEVWNSWSSMKGFRCKATSWTLTC